MAQYRNETLGVVNVDGKFIGPKRTADVSEGALGLDRLVGRGVLSKVESQAQATKTATKQTESKQSDSKNKE